jgi:DNA-binding NarL/FixJ family response regulator
MTTKILLVDDQPLVRGGFRMILEAEEDFYVVGEAADGDEAVALTRQLQPGVVLMDIQMPNLDGLEATRRIAQDVKVSSRVLILTTFERDDYVFEALRAGASGFMLKNAAPEDLVRAVRVVAAGEALLAPSITRRVIEEYSQRAAPRKNETAVARLTDRELEVLRLLATGQSSPRNSSSARERSRRMFPTCSASSVCATGCRPSCSRMRAVSSSPARPESPPFDRHGDSKDLR